VSLGGKVIEMLGLGQTAGITFFAKSTTGLKEGRGSFKDIL
jgi:hypothetical protein